VVCRRVLVAIVVSCGRHRNIVLDMDTHRAIIASAIRLRSIYRERRVHAAHTNFLPDCHMASHARVVVKVCHFHRNARKTLRPCHRIFVARQRDQESLPRVLHLAAWLRRMDHDYRNVLGGCGLCRSYACNVCSVASYRMAKV
jgi:hypothetical protein